MSDRLALANAIGGGAGNGRASTGITLPRHALLAALGVGG